MTEASSPHDPREWLLVGLHILVWWCVYQLVRSNLDAPGDMVEAFAWGQGWQLGYWKHPPLMAWVSGAWFAVIPRSDATYALLVCVNAAVGLLGVRAMAREFLEPRWVFPTMAAAALTPGLTIIAMRFNANAVLLSTWPWAIACFARALRTGQPHHALLAGLTAALALLGKYFSVVLLASLLLAALLHEPWRKRLLSRTGLLMASGAALLLLPHAWWLLTHDALPFRYALDATGFAQGYPVVRAVVFVLVMLVFPVLSFVLLWRVVPRTPDEASGTRIGLGPLLRAVFRPSRDPVWVIAWGPMVLTAALTVLTSARTASLWGLAMSFSLILLVARAVASGSGQPEPRRVWPGLAAVWLLALALAPALWELGARRSLAAVSDPRAELAAALEADWLRTFGVPLKWVTGTRPLAMSAAFYAKQDVRYWNARAPGLDSPWVDPAQARRDGFAMVCDPRAEPGCQADALTLCEGLRTLTVAKQARGHRFAALGFPVVYCAPAP